MQVDGACQNMLPEIDICETNDRRKWVLSAAGRRVKVR